MSLAERYFEPDECHPIDLVEELAEHHSWTFDRVQDDRIAMAVEGQWRTYALTLHWSPRDETLRLICSFEMEPPTYRLPALYEALNAINEDSGIGALSWWNDQRMMLYRYGLVLAGEQSVSPEQIDMMIHTAVTCCERYYPALQLVPRAEKTPKEALEIAIAQTYGRA